MGLTNPDIMCPQTGEVCELKVALSRIDYQHGVPEDGGDFTEFAKTEGLTDTLGIQDCLKVGMITGRLVGPGIEVEDKDSYRNVLNDAECPGSRRSMIFIGKQVCRAPVSTYKLRASADGQTA